MTKSKGILAPRFDWTDEHLKTLRLNFPKQNSQKLANKIGCTIAQLRGKASRLGLKKSAEFLRSADSGRMLPGDNRGAKSRYTTGHKPWSKGKKGLRHPGSEKGYFKKGQQPHNTKSDNEVVIRTSKDGKKYQWIRISVRHWKMLSVYNWEQANGPIKKGHVVAFKDGNTLNADLSNLELITREELMNRNTIHRFPGEIKEVIRAVGKLKRKINEKHN